MGRYSDVWMGHDPREFDDPDGDWREESGKLEKKADENDGGCCGCLAVTGLVAIGGYFLHQYFFS